MESREVLWKKLTRQISDGNQKNYLKRNSINERLEDQTMEFKVGYDREEQIISPTFRKLFEGENQRIEEPNQSFSFGQQMLEEINSLQVRYHNIHQQKPRQTLPSRNDRKERLEEQKKRKKKRQNQVIKKLINFITNIKYLVEGIKNQIKNYQQYFKIQKIYWENYIRLMINNYELKFNREKQQLQDRINKNQYDYYMVTQQYKICQKKCDNMEEQMKQLINQINVEKNSNQVLKGKLGELNQQYQKKIQENTQLYQIKFMLKSQINQLLEDSTSQQVYRSKQLYKTNFDRRSWLQNNDQFRQKCFSTSSEGKNNFMNSIRTTTSPTSNIKDENSNFSESITFDLLKSDKKLGRSGKARKRDGGRMNTVVVKENVNQRNKYPKWLANESDPISKKTIVNQDSQLRLIQKQSRILLSGPLQVLANGQQQLRIGQYDKQKLISQINRLKNEISQEIKYLKMEIN